ncbi:hypothetical protein GF318_00075 [Candidatus Micrarchaeota archaeon]|nr:hypothetical protein [Candidatus Micrarchaeota archaeon]
MNKMEKRERPMTFAQYRRLASELDAFKEKFRNLVQDALKAARNRTSAEARLFFNSASSEAERVKPVYKEMEFRKAMAYLDGEVDNRISEGDFISAAGILAMAFMEETGKESKGQAGPRKGLVLSGLAQLLETTAMKNGVEAAEKICRILPLFGMGVLPENARDTVLAKMEKLENEGNYGRAFDVAAYWSQDLYLGYQPFVGRERLEELFAKAKVL